MTYSPEGLALQIFQKRYALFPEETWGQACERVANHVASAEASGVLSDYRSRFSEVLKANLFMPGGRIWAGSGRPRGQLLNCFVVPTTDSSQGWAKTVHDVIVISAKGGGVGVNCSPARPAGARIAGNGGESTGAIGLMRMINAVGQEIKAGGGRRTALMLCLDLEHGDMDAFLEAKLDLKALTNANVSVNFSRSPEAFFEKVRAGDGSAVQTWSKIVDHALKTGEPGILNGYYANQMSNTWYYKPLISTNPCVSGSTEILTDDGYKRIDSVVGRQVNVWNGFEWSKVEPRITGHDRRMIKVKLSSGQELITTENHHYWLATDYRGGTKRVEAQQLSLGDKLIKHQYPVIEHGEELAEAYSQGFISGDGMDDYNFTYVYEPKFGCLERLSGKAHKESAGKIKFDWNFSPFPKSFVPLKANLKSRLDWLAGLLDSDGTELKEGGAQIASINRSFLLDVQKMLTTMGAASKVTAAQEAAFRSLPDGKGGSKEYYCQNLFRLLIGAVQIQDLKRLGLRCERLSFEKEPNRDASQFVQVVGIEEAGIENTVYCFTEPKRHLGCFGGVVTGQCGEIWLSEYDCCCLGAVVLSRFVSDGEIDWDMLREVVGLGVRFLDDVLVVNTYPLPEISQACSDIRRIGLGVMGLHDMLLKLGHKYNSASGLELVDKVMKFIKNAAYQASIDLAVEKGAFPKFDSHAFGRSRFVKTLKPSIRSQIEEKGIRNCALLTIAPTGTTSMVSAVTSGIEPMFSGAYRRKYRDGDALREEVVIHPLLKEFVSEGRSVKHFQGAYDLKLRDHFEMQRVCQRHLDNATSKTINVPPGTSREELSELYMEYLPELKGVTVYPEGSRENQPLTPIPLSEAVKLVKEDVTSTLEAYAKDSCPDGKCDI